MSNYKNKNPLENSLYGAFTKIDSPRCLDSEPEESITNLRINLEELRDGKSQGEHDLSHFATEFFLDENPDITNKLRAEFPNIFEKNEDTYWFKLSGEFLADMFDKILMDIKKDNAGNLIIPTKVFDPLNHFDTIEENRSDDLQLKLNYPMELFDDVKEDIRSILNNQAINETKYKGYLNDSLTNYIQANVKAVILSLGRIKSQSTSTISETEDSNNNKNAFYVFPQNSFISWVYDNNETAKEVFRHSPTESDNNKDYENPPDRFQSFDKLRRNFKE
jgi:hypothetical protein